jgi:hypothetical protein
MSGNANSAAAAFGAGRFACSARRTISNLTPEELAEVERERSKDRPTSWAHLAARYAVNELDLRRMFDPNKPKAVTEPAKPAPTTFQDHLAARNVRLAEMWLAGVPVADICRALGIGNSVLSKYRARLGLAPRTPGIQKKRTTP